MRTFAFNQKMFAIAPVGRMADLEGIILEASESKAIQKKEEETEMSGQEHVVLEAIVSVSVGVLNGTPYIFGKDQERKVEEPAIAKYGPPKIARGILNNPVKRPRKLEEEYIEENIEGNPNDLNPNVGF